MRWWGWWRDKTEVALPQEEDPEQRRASVTADLDAVIEQVRTDQAAATRSVQIASRKATNASRGVIGRTGTWKAMDIPPPPPKPEESTRS